MSNQTDIRLQVDMTVDEAIGFADEWIRGATIHASSQGWRIVAKLLADEVRALRAPQPQAPKVPDTAESTAQAVEAASNSWRKVAAEAFEAWDSDNDSRLGKLLRAMSDPVFARQYRKDIAALHDTPAIPTEAAQVDPPKLGAMNDALCAFGMRWSLNGDWLTCRKCRRNHIASKHNEAFVHAAECKAGGEFEAHPWHALMQILAPLSAGQVERDAKDANK